MVKKHGTLAIVATLVWLYSPLSFAQSDGDVEDIIDDTSAALEEGQNGLSADDYKKPDESGHVCDSEARRNQEPQLAEYCSAAEVAEEAADANSDMAKVQGGVAALCGASCGLNLYCTMQYKKVGLAEGEMATACSAGNAACAGTAGAGCAACATAIGLFNEAVTSAVTWCTRSNKAKLACTGAGIAGTIADISATNDVASAGAGLMGAMTSIASAEGAFVGSGLFGVSEKAAGQTADKVGSQLGTENNIAGVNEAGLSNTNGLSDQAVSQQNAALQSGDQSGMQKVMACMPFVSATTNMIMKNESAKGSKQTAEENRRLAAQLASQQGNNVSIQRGATGQTNGPDRSSGAGSNGGSRSTGSVSVASSSGCGSSGGGLVATVQCASTIDPSASRVLDPQFQENFRDFTGVDFADFIENGNSSQAVGAAIGNAAGGGGGQIAAAIDGYAATSGIGDGTAYASNRSSGTYRGGGGGRRRGGGDDDFGAAFADALKGITGGAAGKKGKRKPASSKEIAFKMKRTKSQIESDTSLSLFDRITYRYQKNRSELARLPWKSRYNRAIASTKPPKKARAKKKRKRTR